MEIFVSWSGSRSQALAKILKKYLPLIIQDTELFVSSEDIKKGDLWLDTLLDRLKQCNAGILCLTPENLNASWVLFEAGAIAKMREGASVFPVLLGMEKSDIQETPFTYFQATEFNYHDIRKMISSINTLIDKPLSDDVLFESFDNSWPKMQAEAERAASIEIPGTTGNIQRVTQAFTNSGLPQPVTESHAFFDSGFESHSLYATALGLTTERLWIWGRKNRKLFDKEHYNELRRVLSDKNIETRFLFLDPKADPAILKRAHQDENFETQLNDAITQARNVCEKLGANLQTHARTYSLLRHSAVIVVDNAILLCPLEYNPDGTAASLTKRPFQIISSDSQQGDMIIRQFETIWQQSPSL